MSSHTGSCGCDISQIFMEYFTSKIFQEPVICLHCSYIQLEYNNIKYLLRLLAAI